MKIMEFTTQSLAQSCADAIDALAVQYWTDQGRTVQDGTLVSWNAATLVDDAAARRMMAAANTEALFAAAHAAIPLEARKAEMLAKMRRMHYNASIAQGFTPDEALTLCMESVGMD